MSLEGAYERILQLRQKKNAHTKNLYYRLTNKLNVYTKCLYLIVVTFEEGYT